MLVFQQNCSVDAPLTPPRLVVLPTCGVCVQKCTSTALLFLYYAKIHRPFLLPLVATERERERERDIGEDVHKGAVDLCTTSVRLWIVSSSALHRELGAEVQLDVRRKPFITGQMPEKSGITPSLSSRHNARSKVLKVSFASFASFILMVCFIVNYRASSSWGNRSDEVQTSPLDVTRSFNVPHTAPGTERPPGAGTS
ncbi:hypothetical protein F2P81_001463 [Scophthalmus maximus]|uniref:Transmembrane protein n=1 Tax=Scophthalmus maximus TaxID=52904 RepID=A0A6A4TNV8_SCOMX|nr:hypothetical protein F2P81_001463 [Scophthalmus maximus]